MNALKKLFFVSFLFFITHIVGQNSMIHFSVENDLPCETFTDIIQDEIGYLWLASTKGLVKYDGIKFTTYTTKNGLISNNIISLYCNNKQLFIGTDKGLSIKTGNTFKNFECKPIHSILSTKDGIFTGTNLGIYKLKEDYLARLKFNDAIDLSIINHLQFDGTSFWIATNKALWKIDNLHQPKLIDKILNDGTSQLLIEKEKVIATTNTSGIYLFNNSAIELTKSPKEISSIAKTNSTIWVATKNDGIEKLFSDYSFSNKLNKYNGEIPTNKINKLYTDKYQNLWIATQDKGLFKIPNTTTITLKKPVIAFESIEVAYQSLDSISKQYSYPEILKLPSNKNHLSFSFKTVHIQNPKNVFYRYKLNDEFSPWSTSSTINFANLPPGNYTFTAQSKIENLESEPLQFSFYIDKPLHKKTWFIWSSIAFILLLTSIYLYTFIKRIKNKNKAKIEKLELENNLLSLEQKALQLQMNPHFIFNVLNGIKALGNSGKTTELNNTISLFSNLLRGILQNSRLEEISLLDEINTLKNYVNLEQLINNQKFDFTIHQNLSIDIEEILVPPMLIQPFVENSIKHGIATIQKGIITIDFSVYNDFLHCSIIDNGIGIYQSQKNKSSKNHTSLALKVTKERIENLSGNHSFTITELKKEGEIIGTKVWFKLPLKTDF